MTAATSGSAPTFGVDLGGTNLRAALVDRHGRVVARHREHTPGTLDAIVAAIATSVADLAVGQPGAVVAAVGVGAAGMVDRDGMIHYAPNLPAFVRVPLRALVAEATGRPVVVDNDANVAAIAEHTHGAGVGYSNLLLVTLGTGVGGGVVIDGTVFRGAHGFGAEIGHFQIDPEGPMCACGERGHWEAVASGSWLGVLGRTRAADGAAPSVLAARAATRPR